MRLQISRRVNSRRKSRKDILQEEFCPHFQARNGWERGFELSFSYQNSPSSILTMSCWRSAGSTACHSAELWGQWGQQGRVVTTKEPGANKASPIAPGACPLHLSPGIAHPDEIQGLPSVRDLQTALSGDPKSTDFPPDWRHPHLLGASN